MRAMKGKEGMAGPRMAGLIFLAALLALFSGNSHGRVFVVSLDMPVVAFMKSIGGVTAYDAEALINGKQSRVTVISYADGTGRPWNRIRARFPEGKFSSEAGPFSRATLGNDDTTTELIALMPPGASGPLFVAVSSASHAATAGPAADSDFLEETPPRPEGQITFFARDRNSGLGLAVIRSDLSARAVSDSYGTRFSEAGWHSPVSKSRDGSQMKMFIKPGHVCCFMATPLKLGGSSITVLHKPLGVK